MSYGFNPLYSLSSYLPEQFELPKDLEMFRDFVAKRERLTASILNIREIGSYEKVEQLTAQQWFSLTNAPRKPRYTFRKTFDLVDLNGGVIPAGPTTLPHDILGISIPTRIFGTATASGNYLPLPFVNQTTLGNNIEIFFDNTNININNGYGADLDQCYVTFEYIKG